MTRPVATSEAVDEMDALSSRFAIGIWREAARIAAVRGSRDHGGRVLIETEDVREAGRVLAAGRR